MGSEKQTAEEKQKMIEKRKKAMEAQGEKGELSEYGKKALASIKKQFGSK